MGDIFKIDNETRPDIRTEIIRVVLSSRTIIAYCDNGNVEVRGKVVAHDALLVKAFRDAALAGRIDQCVLASEDFQDTRLVFREQTMVHVLPDGGITDGEKVLIGKAAGERFLEWARQVVGGHGVD